jgi:hypothetical protein
VSARPHFEVMDSLNRALFDLKSTIRALYHVDGHVNDYAERKVCREILSQLLMADLGLVEAAEREAWRVVVKGGAA